MARHDAKCENCGWEGEVFFQASAGIKSVPCEKCGELSLQVDWSKGGLRQPWERTWNEETGTSTQLKCRPENVRSVRRRLAACGLDDAHNVVRDDGRFVITDRSTQKRLANAVHRCEEQDRGDKARLGMSDAARQWADL